MRNAMPAGLDIPSGDYQAEEAAFVHYGFFREPLLNVVRLLPNHQSHQFWVGNRFAYLLHGLFKITDFSHNNDFTEVTLHSGGQKKVAATKHDVSGQAKADFHGLGAFAAFGSTGAPAVGVLDDAANNAEHAYVLVSNYTTQPNEGLVLAFLVDGLDGVTSGASLIQFFFGDEFVINFNTNGMATVKRWNQASNSFKKIKTLQYVRDPKTVEGMIFGCTIIPFAQKFLSITFHGSTFSGLGASPMGHVNESPSIPYLVQVSDTSIWDSATQMYRITKPGKVIVGMHKQVQGHAAVNRVRYPTTPQVLKLQPDYIGFPRTHVDPRFTFDGPFNRGNITFRALNEKGLAWAKATHTRLMPEIIMTPGMGLPGSGLEAEAVYSPDLFFVTAEIDPYFATVTRTPIDISTEIVHGEFTMRTDSDGATGNFETKSSSVLYPYREAASFPCYMDIVDGGITFRVLEGKVKNKGKSSQPRPSFNLEFEDDWARLENCYAKDSPIFDGQKIYRAFQWALNTGHYPDEQICVDADVLDLDFVKARRTDSFSLQIDANTNMRDFIRTLMENITDVRIHRTYGRPTWKDLATGAALGAGAQGKRVWHIMRDPDYDWLYGSNQLVISAKFYLAEPKTGAGWPLPSDAVRYAGSPPLLRAKNWEFDIAEPEYTRIGVGSMSSAGADGERQEIGELVNSDAETNVNSPDYIAEQKYHYFAPEVTGIENVSQAAIFGREFYRRVMHRLKIGSMDGEWRPAIEPYQFVEVYGSDFALTNPNLIKYGVFRIEEVSPSIDSPFQHNWWTPYALKYCGPGAAFTPVPLGNVVHGVLV